MSANPSRANLLDVLPGFAEEEERTGIHVRPTLSMPPAPESENRISSLIAALVAESDAEQAAQRTEQKAEPSLAMLDLTAPGDEDLPDTEVAKIPPPSSMGKVATREPAFENARLAAIAVATTAIGFGVGYFFMH